MENYNLIIAEDEPAILLGITSLIERLELPITITGTYSNGTEVLNDLEFSRPDIVLTDVQMPVMSGLELIQQMKQNEYPAEYLVLSGYSEFAYAQQALRLNVSNYLLKPPRIDELRESLLSACAKIRKSRYEKRRQLLQEILFSRHPSAEKDFGMEHALFQVYLCVLGSYTDPGLNLWNMDFRLWSCASILEHLSPAFQEDIHNLWILGDNCPNIKIIVAAQTADSSLSPEELFPLLQKQAEEQNLPLTVAVSDVCEFKDIPKSIAVCNKILRRQMPFEKSQLLKAENPGSPSDSQIEQAIELLWDYIQNNFTANIDVNAFARANGYHPVYLITQFSKKKNISPGKLIIQLKMKRAKQLLAATDLTLKDIAEAVGYSDVSYFSRVFKEHSGMSPGAFRRNYSDSS